MTLSEMGLAVTTTDEVVFDNLIKDTNCTKDLKKFEILQYYQFVIKCD